MSRLQHVNPQTTYDSLSTRGYTQVVAVAGPGNLVFVSGQLPFDHSGKIVAKDIEAQTRAVFENIRLSLLSVGLSFADVVKLNTYVTDVVNHPPQIRKVRAEYFGSTSPPASTMVEVPRFAHPDILIEIDAIAASAAG
jgi:enamine deaminase RidA (YjgF/YER057c/UK114 family)